MSFLYLQISIPNCCNRFVLCSLMQSERCRYVFSGSRITKPTSIIMQLVLFVSQLIQEAIARSTAAYLINNYGTSYGLINYGAVTPCGTIAIRLRLGHDFGFFVFVTMQAGAMSRPSKILNIIIQSLISSRIKVIKVRKSSPNKKYCQLDTNIGTHFAMYLEHYFLLLI